MEKTSTTNVFIDAATVIVAIAGLWLAHNYRRQLALKLSQTRLEAYSRLWEITGIAAPTRLDAGGDDGYLRLDERRDLWAAMTDWYYGKGGGMLLKAITKEVYLNVKHNLVCESSGLRPAGLYDEVRKALNLFPGQELDDKVRGTLAIRLVSLLRTQLKSDLTIYGSTYSGKLADYERLFLEGSGVKLYSKAWATAAGQKAWRLRLSRLRALASTSWKRLRAVAGRRVKEKPQISQISEDQLFYLMSRRMTEREAVATIVRGRKSGRPQPSPLLEIPAILCVKGTSPMPPSSRMAIKNALRGVPIAQQSDGNGTNQLSQRTHGNVQLRLGVITRPGRPLRRKR
jgi:hypothetical protein